MCFPFQALPAPDDGLLEGNVPQPLGGIAERGILVPQYPRLNSPHDGMAGHRPPMPGVSNFSLSGVIPSWTNDTRSTGHGGCSGPVRIPRCRICPRHPTWTYQCPGELQFRCPI